MATTTVRVDLETHARLAAMAAASGTSLIDTARRAVEALEQQQFARTVTAELAPMRLDDEAWEDYLVDADATSVSDGLVHRLGDVDATTSEHISRVLRALLAS